MNAIKQLHQLANNNRYLAYSAGLVIGLTLGALL